ncbi:anti-sigma-D factor RsdA [Pseudonocardia xinjiangensis]|uniref:anti-sigma-D factor RsdA n=1 Tax=Pseudonocardia xinjiangensis TaxID=75289 RepID=UPI003D93797A
MNTRPVPLDEVSEPLDLVAVQADDELINALSAGMTVSSPGRSGYDTDDRVAAILAAWKADVDVEPIPELVDVDTAVATVMAARRPVRRTRRLAPVAAAAAFVVLAVGGVSVSSYNAQPDDALWGVSKVLYSQRAESVEAAVRVEARITKAKEALVAGQPVVAAQELAQAKTDLEVVRPEEGKTELAQVQEFLVAKAAETPQGTPTDPGTPLSTQPSRPVPPGAGVRESPSSGRTAPVAPEPASGTQAPTSVTPAPTSAASAPERSPSDPRDPREPRDPRSRDPRSATPDPRRQQAPVAPGDGTSQNPSPGTQHSSTPSPQPPPTTTDSPSGGGTGSAGPTSGPQTPPATAEGRPDGGATTPAGDTTRSNPGAGGSTGATAAGSGTPPPSATIS